MLYRIDGTYVEDMKDPSEVLLPGGNFILVGLRVKESRYCISFALFYDLPPHLGHGPTISEAVISGMHRVRISGPAHVVSCSIAPSTDLLSSCNRLPSKPRSRVVHTSAQACARST